MNDSQRIANASEWAQQIVIADLPYVMWKRRFMLVLGAFFGLALGILIAFQMKPQYQADALLQVEIRGNGSRATFMEMTEALGLANPAEGEASVMVSRSVVAQAVQKLNLDTKIHPRRSLLDRLAFKPVPRIELEALRIPESFAGSTFFLEVTSSKGDFAFKDTIGNVLFKGTVGTLIDSSSNRARIALRITSLSNAPVGQVFELERMYLEDVALDVSSQIKAEERGKKTALIGLTMTSGSPQVAEIVNAVAEAYIEQDVMRRQKEAERMVIHLEEQLPELKAAMDSSEVALTKYKLHAGSVNLPQETSMILAVIQGLQQQIMSQQDRRKEALQSFRPDHPSVRTIDSSIVLAQAQLANENKKLLVLPDQEKELLRLTREMETATERYQEVLREAQQFRIIRNQKVGNARILDPAIVIPIPGRSKVQVLLLSLMTGFVLAMLGAVGLHFLKGGIGAPDLIEAATWTPVLSIVPRTPEQESLSRSAASGKKGIHILATQSPYEYAVESIRSLKASIFKCISDNGSNKAIVVTSPIPGCGKTFVASNLAVSLAQAGLRIALVDADYRKGVLHKQFGRPRMKGLVELFTGVASIDEISTAVDQPGLTLITCGLALPKPGFSPQRESIEELVSELSKRHDAIVIDAPPLLSIADTAILAQSAAGTLLVLRHDEHGLGEIVDSRKKLQQIDAKILGVVLNDVDPMANINGRRFARQMVKYSPVA